MPKAKIVDATAECLALYPKSSRIPFRTFLFCLVACAMHVPAKPSRRPIDGSILFLSLKQREIHFGHMEEYFTGNVVIPNSRSQPLCVGQRLSIAQRKLENFMAQGHVAAVLMIQDGCVRFRRYGKAGGPGQRWASFSVTKSVTSMLVGAAIRDGLIHSIDDRVSDYLPELKGSAYDAVTIAQLMAMRTGVRWNEDYGDPRADVVRLYGFKPPGGEDRTISYMRHLSRIATPRARWNYNTGEADLMGSLLQAATGRCLADYLSSTIWKRFGMEGKAYWLTDADGQEAGGSGLSMTIDDMARLGEIARTGGAKLVPKGWFERITGASSSVDASGAEYASLWWKLPKRQFAARGIFGQSILVDPQHRIVIAISANWPVAASAKLSVSRSRFEQMLISAASRPCAVIERRKRCYFGHGQEAYGQGRARL